MGYSQTSQESIPSAHFNAIENNWYFHTDTVTSSRSLRKTSKNRFEQTLFLQGFFHRHPQSSI